MAIKLSESELQQLAAHLRCPSGNEGIKVGGMMNVTNSNIISKTISCLTISTGDAILEIGPGNGKHVQELVHAAENITYNGIDISETMVAEASAAYVGNEHISFQLTDGKSINFPDSSFDKIFTVNTIYFWEAPEAYLKEMVRVLKPGGLLCIGFMPERIMEKIPFAKYGFNLYSEDKVKQLLLSGGLTITSEITETEFITGTTGQQIEREFVVLSAKRHK